MSKCLDIENSLKIYKEREICSRIRLESLNKDDPLRDIMQ